MKNIVFAFLFLTACTPRPQVLINQLGHYPDSEKIAITEGSYAGTFRVVDEQTGETVYENTAGETVASPFSGKMLTKLDFTPLNKPGTYRVTTENGTSSPVFSIDYNVLAPLAKKALEAFYLQRSEPGHPDTSVMIHASAVSSERPEGTVISSPKGWYDAGDYNKYIVNASYTTGLVLAGCEQYSGYSLNEKILEEMMYNLQWALTMQDPFDGGVYHKLTTPSFEGFIKPAECKQQRYVVQKTVTATLDFAASMAQAARICRQFPEYSQAAAAMEEAAAYAYGWALKNPDVLYNQFEMNKQYDPDVQTGAYGDRSARDEFFWASCELYLTTGNESYYENAMEYAPGSFSAPTWNNVDGLGYFALLTHGKATETMKQHLISFCDSIARNAQGAAYASSYGNEGRDFFWGCLSESCLSNAISLLYGYGLEGNRGYLDQAYHNMDYLLGRNPLGYCYVTGMGTKSPLNPHHRLAATDGIPGPLPGFLVGGPNPAKQDGCDYPSDLPDESYVDIVESYASNEVAINWNATLLHLAVALDALSLQP
ncbi:MAG: glycoside hydrolase family 9 protein [Bacteroidales bacterium]|jgi:endoglucanase